ncbi:hypothetical protein CONLIGDRAFT_680814 [Coniochaeta ligniaria NRRL 30616]|uniref:Uncharacterized protein n=1 Tax=Coniochaeta ligniaria NRRL 30616 TaxID=1408157 RepID=A0A1J7IQV3_9PEZI|nr:hypothetical protein CONLIGDRAFT_680814 [Coniochaeta ligniaria NRRL 30616]
MGGPLWTAPEEDYFWTQVVPKSDKRLGYDHKIHKDEVESWDTLAREMLVAMRAFRAQTGEEPLRQYNGLMLSEHWDKNVMQNRPSKHAKQYVEAYLAGLANEERGYRWAKRERRVSKKLPRGDETKDDGEAEPKSKKRKRTLGATTTIKTAATGAAAEDDTEEEVSGTQGPPGGPSTELRSIRDLFPETFQRGNAGEDNTRRQLFPSGPSGNNSSGGFGQRANPSSFVDRNDNPYQPRQAPATSRPDIQTIVREAVEARMSEINDMVSRDINQLIEEEVRRRMGDSVHAMVRDEVARQLSSLRASSMTSRSDVERRATANIHRDLQHTARQALSVGGHNPSTAHFYPQQQQGYSSAGRGGPYTSAASLAAEYFPTARSNTRTPLPTARGQFATSHVRSRVRGSGGQDIDDDEEDGEDRHRA